MTMEDTSGTGARSKKDSVKRRGSGDKKRHNSSSVSQDGTSGASMSDDKDKTKRRSSSKRSSTKGKKKDSERELKPQKSFERSSSNQSSTSMEDGQIEMLTPKENGYVDDAEGGEAEEEKGKRNASIKGMWKKAFKSLKSNDKQNWLSKKGSLIRRKDSEEKEEQAQTSKEIDPVYSLLKCAADLPKVPSKSSKETAQCSGGHLGGRGDSSGSTSKASSPSSSASHSPKTRRKRLSARMKSFSLDTPDPPKQLLGIDEMTKKKSSSFTNNCFGAAAGQPGVNNLPVQKKRFGFGTNRSTSLETEEAIKKRSRSSSPQCSPKSKKKEVDVYVSLYHFRGKEKDDMDLRPGSRVTVTNSTDPDWWKGKCTSRTGYFPAKYLLRLQKGQKVYQVTHTMNLTEIDGLGGMRLHKDQIVLCVNEPADNTSVIHVKAANNREAMCPAQFLTEV